MGECWGMEYIGWYTPNLKYFLSWLLEGYVVQIFLSLFFLVLLILACNGKKLSLYCGPLI